MGRGRVVIGPCGLGWTQRVAEMVYFWLVGSVGSFRFCVVRVLQGKYVLSHWAQLCFSTASLYSSPGKCKVDSSAADGSSGYCHCSFYDLVLFNVLCKAKKGFPIQACFTVQMDTANWLPDILLLFLGECFQCTSANLDFVTSGRQMKIVFPSSHGGVNRQQEPGPSCCRLVEFQSAFLWMPEKLS